MRESPRLPGWFGPDDGGRPELHERSGCDFGSDSKLLLSDCFPQDSWVKEGSGGEGGFIHCVLGSEGGGGRGVLQRETHTPPYSFPKTNKQKRRLCPLVWPG